MFTLSSLYENALNTINKRNIHDIAELRKKSATRCESEIKELNISLFYFCYCFKNYSLVQATIRIITCSWIISTLWWTRVSSFRILLRWKCPVSLLGVRFKIWQQRLKRPPWLEENADVQLSAVCYTYILLSQYAWPGAHWWAPGMTYSFRYLKYIYQRCLFYILGALTHLCGVVRFSDRASKASP